MPKVSSDSTVVDDGPVDVTTVDAALENFSLDDIILNMSKTEESPVDIPDDLVPEDKTKEEDPVVEVEAKVEDEAEESEDTEEPEETKTVAQLALETLGLESLNHSEYPDSIEGIVELVKDSSKSLAEDAVDKTLSVNPVLKDFHDFVHNGGDPKAFLNATFPSDDYLNLRSQKTIHRFRSI